MSIKLLLNFIFILALFPHFALYSQPLEKTQTMLIKGQLKKEGFKDSDIAEIEVTDNYYSSSMGLQHIYYQQRYLDIPIENAILNTGFKEGQLVHTINTFVKNINVNPSIINTIISAPTGLNGAMRHLGKGNQGIPNIKSSRSNANGIESNVVFDKGNISKEDIKVSLLWVKDGKSMRLCWESVIDVADNSNEWYHITVDALTGDYVKKYNLVVECNFDDVLCPQENHKNSNGYSSSRSSSTLANTYNVFDLPLESPNHGSRTITSSPWNRTGTGNQATTLGWHDDGSSTYTITRGNNVFAYDDQANTNSPGYSPDGGPSLDFNFPLDISMPPATNIDAAITNLFHTCNLVHDIMYQYGFDEVAGNFQTNNLGRGGSGGDHVLAEGLDGGGTDNANFSTPADGGNGRMQMFLWSDVTPPPLVEVNTPATISSPIDAAESSFSTANKLVNVGPITGNVILVNDLSGGTHEACSANPINNGGDITGNIALIDRGTCNFTEKVKNAQDLGAIAAIVVNNNPLEGPIPMGGEDNTITIPAIMITHTDGEAIKTALMTEPVNITMTGGPVSTPDGSYDNGIIIHEYGHGISNRLTGGPAQAGCLGNDEQMGEGWSDYFALMLTTDWLTAMENDRRGIGTYVQGEPTNGTGIRTYPYTKDIAVNPFTYADVASAPIIQGQVSPHYIGSIWATMLWDMTWNIIDMEGVSTDMYHGTAGNNIALQLVMDGLKLQPCSPGFVDGRDAILLADEMNYGGKYKCAIWEAFARRGLGLSANQGSSGSYTDGVTATDIPSGVILRRSISNDHTVEGEIFQIIAEGICECTPQSNYQVKQDIPAGMSVSTISEGNKIGDQVESSQVNLNALDTVRVAFEARIDLCSSVSPVTLFQDDVEGSALFTSSKIGNKKWVVSTSQSNSPSRSWYVQDYNTQVDLTLTMNGAVSINGPTHFSFYHRFETEYSIDLGGWDGGVVEISTDGGTNWIDLGPYFIENGYPAAFAGNGSSALAGRDAFTGNSDVLFSTSTFVKSVVDLAAYEGQNILIRFRFASDDNTGGTGLNGWYVDDIQFTNISGFITKAYTCQSGVLQDSISKSIEVQSLNQSILYVDHSASGARYGGDWDNAFLSLQDAIQLSECRNINTIYLAEGTYLPLNSRDASFMLRSNMSIIGGFPSGGSILANRDPVNNPSVLSGDIGTAGSNGDNTYHVVYCGAGVTNAILDGIIIEKGNANGGSADNEGAALYNLGSVTLINVITRLNQGNSDVHNSVGADINLQGNTRIEN